ncbi:BTAD domain-containing putative transcriptional regulator [Streptomyces antarcticus]|uniref:BTAD domain-containing putative transcriptional regulator n=1 Tax=Streptomyces antarcticus TaxID=2996458 RepID=UPI00226DB700|nr:MULTISPECIES: BTAD domain-containing putative transcriptional regulator [unclassified Streptomyces]MCY0939793.1 BTAD domain-containing putative transcriptional regulator [Streptomyces sp. H34-AA3]MCZ4080963.1 BTAD domain-containing putative transcriptional regulator [Streptomyces sp. H34-S5]
MSAGNSLHVVQFALLNGVTATRGEHAIALGPPQRRALLCALALRRRQWVSMNTLVDALYEEDAPAGATKVIQTHVSALRGVLEPPRPAGAPPVLLLYGHGGYQLRIADEQLDLAVFDRLVGEAERARARQQWQAADASYTRALALFSSEPLAGVPGPYAEHQRTALLARRLVVVEDALEAAVMGGRAGQVIDQLRTFTAEHPLRERLHALLMQALHAGGRPSEALQAYTRAREILVDELGVEPGSELRALHARVLAGEPPSRPLGPLPAAPAPAADLPVPVASAPGHVAGFPMVGRERELHQITGLAGELPSGQGGLVVISGGPGMGKSLLLREVGRHLPSSRRLPLTGGGEPALVSGLRGALGSSSRPAPASEADARTLADWACRELADAGRPLVLLADDAGDSDDGSRQALVILAQRLRHLPVLWVQVAPGTHHDASTAEWHAELEARSALAVSLGPLDVPAIVALAGRVLAAPESVPLATVVHQVTGGVPVLVHALLADLKGVHHQDGLPRDLIPDHFTRALSCLLHRHDPVDARLVRALAVLAEHAPSAVLLAAVCAQPVEETRLRCADLTRRGVLASAEPPRLRHPLIATALLNACSSVEKTSIRVAAAECAQMAQRPVREVADHLGELAGTQWARWATVLIDAANECLREGAAAPAIGYLEAALRVTEPAERAAVLLRLGQAELQTNPNAACIHLQEALQIQRDLGQAPTAVVPLAWVLVSQGRMAAAISLMDTVVAETEAVDPGAARAVRAAGWMIFSLTPGTWHTLIRKVSAAPPTCAADEVVAQALVLYDDAIRLRYSAKEALERCPTDRSVSDSTELPRQLVGMRAALAVWCDDYTLVEHLCDQPNDHDFAAVDLSRVMNRAEVALRRGDYRRALAECRLLTSVPLDQNVRRPAAMVGLYAHALIGLGRTDEAERWLDSAHHHAEPETWPWVTVLYVRGLLRSAQGNAQQAAAHFLDCGRRLAAWNIETPGFQPWRSSAALELAALGQQEGARALAEEALDVATRWGAPRPLGMAWRAMAACLPAQQRVVPLERAVVLLEQGEARTELAAALTDLAVAYSAAGDPRHAQPLFQRARDLAEESEAVLLVRRIDDCVRRESADREEAEARERSDREDAAGLGPARV